MAIWEHLAPSKTHIAYACIGVFSTIFSLCSLFIKEKLYIGEASVAVIFGLIVGPHCLNWFAPEDWGNLDLITLAAGTTERQTP
jgi:CPA1 family monovalent cation:H+ antiporter